MRYTVAIIAFLLATPAAASHLSFEIKPFLADFDARFNGSIGSEVLPNIRIESSGASVTGVFGEILEMNEEITVTISDRAASAGYLYDEFILPQVFSGSPVNPAISSDGVGFQNNVLLRGRNLFGRLYGIDIFTILLGAGPAFDRQVSLDVDELGFISGGILDDKFVNAIVFDTVSSLQQFTFAGPSTQILTFDSKFRFQINSILPIPIPATVWLLGAGLIGLVGFSRRRKTA